MFNDTSHKTTGNLFERNPTAILFLGLCFGIVLFDACSLSMAALGWLAGLG